MILISVWRFPERSLRRKYGTKVSFCGDTSADSLIPPIKSLKKMKRLEKQLSDVSTVEEVMGLEGMAARVYFSVLSRFVQPDFAFHGRSRQPPKDAFNSMLSLGYTLLMYELYAEIENRGFSPYVGFMHRTHRGHPSLASDLMEEWRAVVVDPLP